MRRFASWRRAAATAVLVPLLVYLGLVAVRTLYPIAYVDQIVAFSSENALDPALVAAVIRCESRFRPGVVSSEGAIGLMQIMPSTGEWIAQQLGGSGIEAAQLYDPTVNVRLGTWYLAHLLDRFPSVEDALRAYNAGPSHAQDWVDDPADVFAETRSFVERVTRIIPVYRMYFRAPWLLRITPSLLV